MPTYFSSTDFLGSLAGAIRDAFTQPTELFRQMPKATSYKDVSILLVVVMVLPTMLILLMRSKAVLLPLPELASIPLFVLMLAFLIFAIPLTLAGAWLWACYLSWVVRRFAGGSLSTIDAFQIYAYSSIPNLLNWVPVFGFIMGIWSVYLEWKGLTTFAGVSGGKALLIIFVPIIVLIVSLSILGVLVAIYLMQQPQTGNAQMF